jgi:hypothetical protein
MRAEHELLEFTAILLSEASDGTREKVGLLNPMLYAVVSDYAKAHGITPPPPVTTRLQRLPQVPVHHLARGMLDAGRVDYHSSYTASYVRAPTAAAEDMEVRRLSTPIRSVTLQGERGYREWLHIAADPHGQHVWSDCTWLATQVCMRVGIDVLDLHNRGDAHLDLTRMGHHMVVRRTP